MAHPDLPSPSQPAESGPPRLTPREQATYDELSLIDVQLAHVFERGVAARREIELPANALVVAHMGREVSLGVIEALTAQGAAGPPPDTESVAKDDKYSAVIAAALDLPPSHPLVKAWHANYRRLVGFAHYRRGDPPPPSDQVAAAFQSLTDMLFGRIAPYFQTQDDLDALLSVAIPDSSHVEQLNRLLLRTTQRAYFFRRLAHVEWLRPLIEAGLFSAPPDAVSDEGGSRFSWSPWPEGDYLVRMAAQEPRLVFEALKGIRSTLKNPVVWYSAAQAALALPPDLSRQLVPGFCSALDGPVLFLFPRTLVDLAIKLANAGATKEAFSLAEKLTEMTSHQGDQRSGLARALGHNDVLFRRIEADDAEDLAEGLLPALERLDPVRCLELLAKRAAFAIGAHQAERENHDHSWIWCEDLQTPDQIRNDLRAIFLRAAAGVARRYAGRGKEEGSQVLALLKRYPLDAFRRLELFVLLDAGHHFPERIDAALVDKDLIDGSNGHRELGPFIAKHFEIAGAAARERFVEILTAGWDRQEVADMLRRWERDPSENDITEWIRGWQADRLGWFGDKVPAELRDLAAVVAPTVSRRADAEKEVEQRMAILSGERVVSPLTVDQLLPMSGNDVVAFLQSWKPREEEPEAGSVGGLARALTEFVAKNPDRSAALLDAIRESAE